MSDVMRAIGNQLHPQPLYVLLLLCRTQTWPAEYVHLSNIWFFTKFWHQIETLSVITIHTSWLSLGWNAVEFYWTVWHIWYQASDLCLIWYTNLSIFKQINSMDSLYLLLYWVCVWVRALPSSDRKFYKHNKCVLFVHFQKQLKPGKLNIRDVASMRCSSTVSAPVQHCCAPLTAHHSRYIAVQLLTNQVLYFVTEVRILLVLPTNVIDNVECCTVYTFVMNCFS